MEGGEGWGIERIRRGGGGSRGKRGIRGANVNKLCLGEYVIVVKVTSHKKINLHNYM